MKKTCTYIMFLSVLILFTSCSGESGDKNIESLVNCGLPFYLGSWMSKKIELLNNCVGRELNQNSADYHPWHNLEALHESYPHRGIYLSLLSFKQQWENFLPVLKEFSVKR